MANGNTSADTSPASSATQHAPPLPAANHPSEDTPMETQDTAIDFDRIKDRYWRYAHVNGFITADLMTFLPDGEIAGHDHPNERYWQIDNGVLELMNAEKIVTIRFDDVQLEDNRLRLTGTHLPDPALILQLQEQTGRPSNHTTREALESEIKYHGWSIGKHTYGLPNLIDKEYARLTIGSYCSIAANVNIAFANHRTDILTTYPFKALGRFWHNVPRDAEDHHTRGDITIGNDVWIGTGAFIGSGVTIGSGAVIAAMAVVVRDVPPYAIVAGNPAKLIRHRFDPNTIQELLTLAWWDLDDDTVDTLVPLLLSKDSTAFLTALRTIRECLD